MLATVLCMIIASIFDIKMHLNQHHHDSRLLLLLSTLLLSVLLQKSAEEKERENVEEKSVSLLPTA